MTHVVAANVSGFCPPALFTVSVFMEHPFTTLHLLSAVLMWVLNLLWIFLMLVVLTMKLFGYHYKVTVVLEIDFMYDKYMYQIESL